MSQTIETVAVIGAGAMGCLFAARMQEAGAAVTLIDVNMGRLDQIAARGLELHDDSGTRTIGLAVSDAASFTAPVDLLLFFTKGFHTKAAAHSVAHLAEHRPIALTLQNGLGNAEILADIFSPDHVLMGTAHVPADIESDTRVTTHGFANIHLGGFNQHAHAYADAVADLLKQAGLGPTVSADVEVSVWEKLAFNAALNALAMITHSTNGELNSESGIRIAYAVVAETVAVARARQLVLDHAGIESSVRDALIGHPQHKASMLQDREAGRFTEIEMINGRISSEGCRLGVPTPANDTLADLVRIIEAKRSSQPTSVPEGGSGIR